MLSRRRKLTLTLSLDYEIDDSIAPCLPDPNAPEMTADEFVDKQTIIDWMANMVETKKSQYAMIIRDNNAITRMYTWEQYRKEVLHFAKGLVQIGFEMNESVLVQGSTVCPRLLFANLGIIHAGGVVSILPSELLIGMNNRSSSANLEQLAEVLQASKATVIVVQDYDGLHRLLNRMSQHALKQLRAIVVLSVDFDSERHQGVYIYCYDDFVRKDDAHDESLMQIAVMVEPTNIAIQIFDYGSHGKLHGVLLSHDNVYYTAMALSKDMDATDTCDKIVGYLPLHHISSQMFEIYLPISTGMELYFISKDETLKTALQNVRPTLFAATPTAWNAISLALRREKEKSSHSKGVLYTWAKSRAKSNSRKLQYGSGSGTSSFGHMLANQVVLKSIKKRLGLSKCRACYGILAPVDLAVMELFYSMDIPIYQVYGSAETCGFAALNTPNSWMFGSYGRPLTGSNMHVNTMTKEIYFHGRNIFTGYNGPSAATVDAANWFHSGDSGLLNPDGFVVVDELCHGFVCLSSGDSVPVGPYQKALVETLSELARVIIVGDGRDYLVALLVLKIQDSDLDGDLAAPEVLRLSRELDSDARTIQEISRCPKWSIHFDNTIEKLNNEALLDCHQVHRWTIMPRDFGSEWGELDPVTLEPRRLFIQRKFKALLDTVYGTL